MWSFDKIDPERRINGFELYGFDIMLDEEFNVYLIEVNTNPWLETPSSLLSSIISSVLDHTFKITLDFLFPNPNSQQSKNLVCNKIGFEIHGPLSKFELIFDEKLDRISTQEDINESDSDDLTLSEDSNYNSS